MPPDPSGSSANRPIRVLHVIGAMNRAGVESWLMQVLRNIDRDRFQFDFLVHTTQSADFDAEIRALGSRILPCPGFKRPWQYAANFARIISENGPYDIVHSHVSAYSGYVLMLAHRHGVPTRIAHSHSNTSRKRRTANPARRVYLKLADEGIRRYATLGLAVGEQAASALYGPDWQDDPARRLLYYGVDFTPFPAEVDPAAVRAEFGIQPGEFVVGHVGRFTEPKNHPFFVRVAADIVRREPRSRFLLIGDGPLRPRIEAQVRDLGLADRFLFTGVRPDVPRLMSTALDVMLFPSLWEGLPVTAIESQAAALPVVASPAIPDEAIVVPPLFERLSLEDSPARWADAVFQAASARSQISRSQALQSMRESRFAVDQTVNALCDIYTTTVQTPISQAA